MKVLFTARKTLFSQPGGDTQQVVQTADALRELGHEIDIILNGEEIDFTEYALVHFFNFGRPADILGHLKEINVPLIVSSIWVDYSEYDHMRQDLTGKMQRIFGTPTLEFAKTMARGINGTDEFPDAAYLLKGHQRSMRKLAKKAAIFIASSASEKNRLHQHFSLQEKTKVVPLGLPDIYWENHAPEKRQGVISVGRIEGLKNQLNLVRAAKNKPWPLTIIGKPAINQTDYYETCQNEASKNIHFAGWRDGEHLLRAYRTAKVLVLPSYFETFGLVALEALSQGCKIVLANRPDMNSIFDEHATFFNPNDPEDMAEKIEAALKLPPFVPTKKLRESHNWLAIAQEIEAVYARVLERSVS